MACGAGDDDPASTPGTAVRPFSEVQASDFKFEADPTDPGRGVFRVTTTEPMICAIVETTAQVLRFDIEASTGGNVGAVEVRVLAP